MKLTASISRLFIICLFSLYVTGLSAQTEEQKAMVKLSFQRTENGEFNEFGLQLVGGEWVKNFEDILQPTTELIIKDH